MAFISHLVYRSYKRVVVVLYRLVRLCIASGLSSCYALIWRLYAVVWRTMAVYIVGYAVMAYGLGLRDRRVGVACVVGCVCAVWSREGVAC